MPEEQEEEARRDKDTPRATAGEPGVSFEIGGGHTPHSTLHTASLVSRVEFRGDRNAAFTQRLPWTPLAPTPGTGSRGALSRPGRRF